MATSIRRISAQSLKPGMTLANAIMSDANSMLVAAKTCLTQSVIDRLLASKLVYADILVDSGPEGLSHGQQAEQKLLNQQIRIAGAVKESFERMRLTRALPYEEFSEMANEISTTMIDTPGILNSLHMVKAVDNYTYTHSVNVGVLAGLIGKWTGYRNVPELVMAGLLHDVGKTQIPIHILNKPSFLSDTEMAVMRLHSTLGYELAMGSTSISENVMKGILHHHERLDGSGYPNRLKAGEVSYVPKVLAIADVFDAMTSKRVYRDALTPFDVLEEIFIEMFSKLDPRFAMFLGRELKNCLWVAQFC